jgi:hypothetical protein
LTTLLTNLVGADPFALDRPGTEALMVCSIAGEVAMLDETSSSVAALEVNDLELGHDQYAPRRLEVVDM